MDSRVGAMNLDHSPSSSPIRGNTRKGSTNTSSTSSSSNAFVALSFPPTSSTSTYPSNLTALTDETSTYASVARTCLNLCQYATSACSSLSSGSYEGSGRHEEQSCLIHEETFCGEVSDAVKAMVGCIGEHKSAKCRALVMKCAAILARSAFARLRFDSQLSTTSYAPPHSPAARVEDECASDVPTALAEAALNDTDEAAAAVAFESLALLCMDARQDPLTTHMHQIAFSSLPPPPDSMLWEDHMQASLEELKHRILSNIIPYRIRRMVHRATLLRPARLQLHCIPFLSWALSHLTLTSTCIPGMISSEQYSKRWFEIDIHALADEFLTDVLLPNMMDAMDGTLAMGSSLATLRLADVNKVGSMYSSESLCRSAVFILLSSLRNAGDFGGNNADGGDMVEARATTLAACIVACRGMGLEVRFHLVLQILEEVMCLPPCENSPTPQPQPPPQAPSSSTNLTTTTQLHTRPPPINVGFSRKAFRIGLLTECVILLLMDASPTTTLQGGSFSSSSDRHSALVRLLETDAFVSAMNNRTSMNVFPQRPTSRATPHVAEEMVLSFCTAALLMGTRLQDPQQQQQQGSSSSSSSASHQPAGLNEPAHATTTVVEEWLRCSLAILSSCCSCLNWRSHQVCDTEGQYVRKAGSLGHEAAAEAYLALFLCCLRAVDLLPRDVLEEMHGKGFGLPSSWVGVEGQYGYGHGHEHFAILPVWSHEYNWIKRDMSALAEHIVQEKIRDGIPSSLIRVRLLSILSRVWMHQIKHWNEPSKNNNSNNDAVGPPSHLLNAPEILSVFFSDILSFLDRECTEPLELFLLCLRSVEAMAICAAQAETSQQQQPSFPCSSTSEDGNSSAAAVPGDYIQEVLSTSLDILHLEGRPHDVDESSKIVQLCAEAAIRVKCAREHRSVSPFGGAREDLACLDAKLESRRHMYETVAEWQWALFWQHAKLAVLTRVEAALRCCELCFENVSLRGTIGGGEEEGEEAVVVVRPIRERQFMRLHTRQQSLQSKANSVLAVTVINPQDRWSDASMSITGSSDPIVANISYDVRRFCNGAQEDERRLVATLRVHNITAVAIPAGLRLDLTAVQLGTRDDVDPTPLSSEIQAALRPDSDDSIFGQDVSSFSPISSSSATFRGEIKPGDFLSWEVVLDHWSAGSIGLNTSISFREMELETTRYRWVSGSRQLKNESKRSSHLEHVDEGTETADGNLTDTDTTAGMSTDEAAEDEHDDEALWSWTLSAEPLHVCAQVLLQPCPIVFSGASSFLALRGKQNVAAGVGDVVSFDILWSNMTHVVPMLTLVKRDKGQSGDDYGPSAGRAFRSIAKQASMILSDCFSNAKGSSICEGWAFQSWCGYHVLCKMTESTQKRIQASETPTAASSSGCEMSIRGDNAELLLSLVASRTARQRWVADLTNGEWECLESEMDPLTLGVGGMVIQEDL